MTPPWVKFRIACIAFFHLYDTYFIRSCSLTSCDLLVTSPPKLQSTPVQKQAYLYWSPCFYEWVPANYDLWMQGQQVLVGWVIFIRSTCLTHSIMKMPYRTASVMALSRCAWEHNRMGVVARWKCLQVITYAYMQPYKDGWHVYCR